MKMDELRFYRDGDYVIMYAKATPEILQKCQNFLGATIFENVGLEDTAKAEEPKLTFTDDETFTKALRLLKDGANLSRAEKQAAHNYLQSIERTEKNKEEKIKRLISLRAVYNEKFLIEKMGYPDLETLCQSGTDQEISISYDAMMRYIDKLKKK